jgi:hypothetical protein
MADALKAEGNKLFAAKDFEGSMFVEIQPCSKAYYRANKTAVRSSHRLSSLTLQTMCYTRTDQDHMLP